MKLQMKFKEYLQIQAPFSNLPAKLSTLTSPFGLEWAEYDEDYLMVGHILDALAVSLRDEDPIDPFDIATIAWELGSLDAGRFLDEAPQMIDRKIGVVKGSLLN